MQNPSISTRRRLGVIAAAIFAVALFLALSVSFGDLGFPLDDAWIHQTYARNLVESGRMEYTPGVVSAGSTAPLWTLLLAVGYLLRLPFILWSHLLGGLSLLALALAAMRLWRELWPQLAHRDWVLGLVIVFTWPLVWAAVSGMETLLFAAIGLWIVTLFAGRTRSATEELGSDLTEGRYLAATGFLSGLLILLRPDGVVLISLILIGLGVERVSWRKHGLRFAVLAFTALVPLVPYLVFNLQTSGQIWPNTFYAKQAEYQTLLAQPVLLRFFRLLFFSLGGPETGWRGSSGAHLFLLPGTVASVWLALRADWQSRRLRQLLPFLWAGAHVFLYAWRLPVTYQHGRYLMAALPVWVLYGMAGWGWLLSRLGVQRVARLGKTTAVLTFAVLVVVFLLLGAQAYATDVAFIEGEMVDVAHWLAQNTPAESLIAAHDIGAIGYFAGRPILDLAGLISPQVIPWLDDETKLSAYILSSDADYLVTAPGWPYVEVAASDRAIQLYTSGYKWTLDQGVNNMSVYRFSQP